MTVGVSYGRSVTGMYYCVFVQKLRRKMNKNRPKLLVAGPLILHDNAPSHIADVLTKARDYGWELLLHSPDSPDTRPPDVNLFPKLKEPIVWTFFFSGRAFYRRYPSYSTHE